jgi:hypothetical protein
MSLDSLISTRTLCVHFWCSLRFLGKLENTEANSFFPSSCSCSIHVDGQSAHCPRRLRLHRFPTRSANLPPPLYLFSLICPLFPLPPVASLLQGWCPAPFYGHSQHRRTMLPPPPPLPFPRRCGARRRPYSLARETLAPP